MKLGVMGAGAIGCYLGGRLQAAGHEVRLTGRASVGRELAERGLTLDDYLGRRAQLAPAQLSFSETPEALAGCECVLVTVKATGTAEAAAQLSSHLAPGAVVVSFQNGVKNPGILRGALPEQRVLAGMVPFNVMRTEPGHFHRGTSGALVLEREPSGAQRPLAAALAGSGLEVETRSDVLAVQWGKLLVNLGNSVNALCGLPLVEQLADRRLRRVVAAAVAEGVAALRKEGIAPKMPVPLPAAWVPRLLRLPDFLFLKLARSMVRVDPHARSSMWDDLERRRKTEVELLNGEIVELAAKHGLSAPVNAAIRERIHAAEAAGGGSPRLSAEVLEGLLAVTPPG